MRSSRPQIGAHRKENWKRFRTETEINEENEKKKEEKIKEEGINKTVIVSDGKENAQINDDDKRKKKGRKLVKEEDIDRNVIANDGKKKVQTDDCCKRKENENEDPYTAALKRFHVSKSIGKENRKEENENVMFREIESKLSAGILSSFEYNVHGRKIQNFNG